MITIIAGTNRPESRTTLFASAYATQLTELGQEAQLLDLAELHHGYVGGKMYDPLGNDPQLLEWHQRYISGVDKLAIFVPEYNGSFPGVLKVFIDAISIIDYSGSFGGKHIAIVGLASGRSGNIRGMDHLADVLAHMGAWVLPNRLPISSIEELLRDGRLTDEPTKMALKKQAQQLIAA